MDMQQTGSEPSAGALADAAVMEAKPQGNFGLGIVLGFLAAVAAAAAWAAVAIFTHYEIGWLAWGVGALVGAACLVGAKVASTQLGVVAVAIAIFSLLIAKLMIFQWAAPAELRNEVLNNPAMMQQAAQLHLMATGGYPPELLKEAEEMPEDSPQWPELQTKFEAVATEKLAAMTQEEKQAAAQVMTDLVLAQVSATERVQAMLSPMDALWSILAIVSAWGIASGRAANKGGA